MFYDRGSSWILHFYFENSLEYLHICCMKHSGKAYDVPKWPDLPNCFWYSSSCIAIFLLDLCLEGSVAKYTPWNDISSSL